MVQSILYLVVGIFIGSLVSSLIFIRNIKADKKKQANSIEERNNLLQSIAEMFVNIDALFDSFRSGFIKADGFTQTVNSKLNAINKIFKTNLHLLDAYQAKYIDSQFDKYSEQIKSKFINSHCDDNSMLENQELAIVDDKIETELSEAENVKNSVQDNVNENIVNSNIEEAPKTQIIFEFGSDDAVIDESESIQNSDSNYVSDLFGKEENSAVKLEDSEVNSSIIVENKSNEDKIIATDDSGLNEPDQDSAGIDEQKIEKKISNFQSDDEITFEVAPQESGEPKNASIADTTIEMLKSEPVISEMKPDVNSNQNPKSSFQQEFELAAKELQGDDLIETIMDLDMSKIIRLSSPAKDLAAENVSINEEKNKNTDPAEICNDVSNSKNEQNEQQSFVVNENNNETVAISENKTSSEFEISSNDSDHATITGDDVADKIDSFFGFK